MRHNYLECARQASARTTLALRCARLRSAACRGALCRSHLPLRQQRTCSAWCVEARGLLLRLPSLGHPCDARCRWSPACRSDRRPKRATRARAQVRCWPWRRMPSSAFSSKQRKGALRRCGLARPSGGRTRGSLRSQAPPGATLEKDANGLSQNGYGFGLWVFL